MLKTCLFILQCLVKRADLRLLRPPWWDELNEATSHLTLLQPLVSSNLRDTRPQLSSSRIEHEGQLTREKQYYNSTDTEQVLLQTSTSCLTLHPETKRYEIRNSPLQLHQVLPTFHAAENHYRVAATSPFQSTNNAIEHMSDSVITSRGSITLIRSTPTSFQTTSELIVPHMDNFHTALKSNNPNNPPGCSEDIQRIYTKDEYESEDELRREDISFNNDGGKLMYINGSSGAIAIPGAEVCS